MNDAENFILTTDYATSKGDGIASASITVPGSLSLAVNQVLQYTEVVNVGVAGSIIRSRIASSKESNRFYVCSMLNCARTGSGSFTYSVYATVSRDSSGSLLFRVIVPNPYNFSLTTEAGSETINFEASTFIPPIG